MLGVIFSCIKNTYPEEARATLAEAWIIVLIVVNLGGLLDSERLGIDLPGERLGDR